MVTGQLHTHCSVDRGDIYVHLNHGQIFRFDSGAKQQVHTKNYKSTIIELVSSQRPCTENNHCACVCEGFI